MFNKGFVKTCQRIGLACLLTLSCSVWADVSNEQVAHASELHIQPNTCVSLHQGQACFATLTMSWNTPVSNNYCLYSSANELPIKCWHASKQGAITEQISSAQTLHFYLKIENSNTVVAESVFKVSWVYKKQQKSRLTWRLF